MKKRKKENKFIKFARFGGLSPVVQKGYDTKMSGFHSPPKRKGIYCFIHPYYEPFLLGGEFSNIKTKHSKFDYLKDKNGNKIEYNDNNEHFYDKNFLKVFSTTNNIFYDKEKDDYYEKGKKYWVKPKKPKIFTYTGDIWHHLGKHLDLIEIKEKKGKWVLTNYKNFEKAFYKERHELLKEKMKFYKENKIGKNLFDKMSKNPFDFFTKDHLEVFIERVK